MIRIIIIIVGTVVSIIGATFYLSHDQQEINITEEIQISAEGIADVYSTCHLTTSLKDFKENKVLDNTQVSRKIVLMVTNSPIPFDKSGKAKEEVMFNHIN